MKLTVHRQGCTRYTDAEKIQLHQIQDTVARHRVVPRGTEDEGATFSWGTKKALLGIASLVLSWKIQGKVLPGIQEQIGHSK